MDAITDRNEKPDAPAVPSADGDAGRRGRGRGHPAWIYAGIGLGIVLGLALTALHAREVGYTVLFADFVFNLIWAQSLGAIIGFGLGRFGRPGPRRWERPQLRTRTLMVVVAYIGCFLGAALWARRLSNAAYQYLVKFSTANSMIEAYNVGSRKAGPEVLLRRTTVEGLRSGKIPEGLNPLQRVFLQGLEDDPKVTPEYRTERRDLILAGEEWQLALAEWNVVVSRETIGYNERLAAKYDRARWHPWLPVEPDPPAPKFPPAPEFVNPLDRARSGSPTGRIGS